MGQDNASDKISKTSLTRRTVLSGAAAMGLSTVARAQAAGRGQGRPDRAAVGHLHPPRPGDEDGRRDGHRAHQRARRHQVARRRQDEARRDRLRRHHGEGQERGAAHGGAGDRSGCGDRLLSELFHAGGDRGNGTRATAGADAVLFGPADRSRLQVHFPDRSARQRAIRTRLARTDEACGNRLRQAAEDRGDADGQHGDLGRDRQGAQGEAPRAGGPSARGRGSLDAAALRRHPADPEGQVGQAGPAAVHAERDLRRQARPGEDQRIRPRTRQDSDRLLQHHHCRAGHAAKRHARGRPGHHDHRRQLGLQGT